MEDLLLLKTEFTPEIELSKSRSVFRFSGNSLTENAVDFYKPVIKWIKEYANEVTGNSHFDCQFSEISQASLKSLLFVFQEIKAIEMEGHAISVAWYLPEDEAKMKEIGQDISYMTDVPFEYIFSKSKQDTPELV